MADRPASGLGGVPFQVSDPQLIPSKRYFGYYIIAGAFRLGTEKLGLRDSFFAPADKPCKPGPDGVELFEIRHAATHNFLILAKSETLREKAAETTAQHRDAWKSAKRPSLNA